MVVHCLRQSRNRLLVVVLHYQNLNRIQNHLVRYPLQNQIRLLVVVVLHYLDQIPNHLVVHFLHRYRNQMVVVVPQIHFLNRTRFDQDHQILTHLVVHCLRPSRNHLLMVVVLRCLDPIQIRFLDRCLHRNLSRLVVQ